MMQYKYNHIFPSQHGVTCAKLVFLCRDPPKLYMYMYMSISLVPTTDQARHPVSGCVES